MPKNTVNKCCSVTKTDDCINELRNKFLDSYRNDPQDYDPIDVETVRTNDFPVKRFLTFNDYDMKLSFDQMVETMKWRKSYGVNKLDYSRIAIELYKCAAIFQYNYDIDGRPVLYVRVKTYVKIHEMEKQMQDVIVIILNQIDQMSGEKGYTVVMDVTGAGLRNVDLSMARFVIKIMRKYFPESVKSILLYNLPFVMRSFIPIVKFMFGDRYGKLLNSVNGDEIFLFISRDNVPKYLGGNCDKDFTEPPVECKFRAEEMAHLYGISTESMRNHIKQFDVHIKEAKQLVEYNNK